MPRSSQIKTYKKKFVKIVIANLILTLISALYTRSFLINTVDKVIADSYDINNSTNSTIDPVPQPFQYSNAMNFSGKVVINSTNANSTFAISYSGSTANYSTINASKASLPTTTSIA